MSESPPAGPPAPWPQSPEDLYDHAPCGYLTTLADGTIVKVNETFLRWTGYRREDLVGQRRFKDLLTVGGRIYHETHLAPLLRMQGEVSEVALELRCADERRLPILLNSVLEVDAAGAPRAVRTTVFNATERRRYERELMLARRVAEESESRLRILQDVVVALSAAPTALGVAAALLRAADPAFGAAGGAVWLRDRAGHRLTVAATSGRLTGLAEPVDLARIQQPAEAGDPARIQQPAEPGDPAGGLLAAEAGDPGGGQPLAEAVRRCEVLVVTAPPEAGRRFAPLAGAAPRWTGQCVVLLPLVLAGEALGVLAFGFAERREFDDSQRRLATLLGEQAGQSLDRARLYDEARQRESRSALLAATTRAMEEVRGVAPRAQRLVDQLVPEVAEWAAVRLGGAEGITAWAGFANAGPGPAPPGTGRLPDPSAQVLADPIAQVLAEPIAQVLAEPIAQVLASGEPRLSTGPGDEASMVLPLRVRGRVVGTLSVGGPGYGHRGPEDLRFLSELADRVGLTLENARLYDQEHQIAQTLQRSLLAGDPPRDPRFSVTTHYRPAVEALEVGGDWYDSFLITTDKLSVVVGDVVGRGIEAATAMGQLRSAIRALAAAELGPATLVERLDRFAERLEAARMATVAYAEITLSTGEMTYCCAGHLPPVLQGPDGEPRLLWGGRSAPVGARAGRTARGEERIRLAPGSRLLLYTDGLIERRTRSLDVGFRELLAELGERRNTPLPGLAAQLAGTLVAPGQRDDVCLLLLSFGAADEFARTIVADVHQIAGLRHDLRGWLAGHAVAADNQDALLLACSEAVANAVEHGYRRDGRGLVEVTATLGSDAVELCVHDRGSWLARPADPVRGRGLFIIRQVMDEVMLDRDDTGTTVTMRRWLKEGRGA